ncbi:hypothetical protein J6590_049629 [Homalodisca vitripennis]|nr:hypothetical protein J6590_049629 [Homalodisca vitripennis]
MEVLSRGMFFFRRHQRGAAPKVLSKPALMAGGTRILGGGIGKTRKYNKAMHQLNGRRDSAITLSTRRSTLTSQKWMCHFNLGNPMDVQERHMSRFWGGCKDSSIGLVYCGRLLLELGRACHSLPALTGEAGSELASTSSEFRQEAAPIPNLTHPEYPVTPEEAQRSL